MNSFEEAYKIATLYRDDFDYCSEWENGYVFGLRYDGPDEELPRGGKWTPIVVLKEDGTRTGMPLFVMRGTGKYLGGVDLQTGAKIEIDENDL